ncbi:hypothetical protein [Citreimonas salinaria]|uniref:Uncharacterized protein n=1 Tax=Citreimonas salinaria TaxID=321339 RepID=A0A1H3J4Q9_9RHOB|nr:hypothetical protein [Citreimonas salinaria]SDY34144.1 hypothetical protein SAMN05444340_10619 [Citreimonas salinaria]
MKDLVRILIGPLVWLSAFSAVYGLHGVACAFGWADIDAWGLSLMRVALTAAWLASLAVLAVTVAVLHSRRFGSPSGFVRGVSIMTGWVGLMATLWTLFPVVVTSTCQ